MRSGAIHSAQNNAIIRHNLRYICTLLALCLLSACRAETPPAITATVSPAVFATAEATTEPTLTPVESRSPELAEPETPTPIAPEPSEGIALLGLVGQPRSLNPITENHPALRELSPLLFETLLQAEPNTARLQPGLAQDWSFSEEEQRVTFHFPPNLKWGNGESMTAADIVDSLKATQHPALSAFNRITAPDENTLSLGFISPNCSAITALALLPLLPSAEIRAEKPVGSGPFVVSRWSENKRTLTLARNPNYHGPGPDLGGVTIRFLEKEVLDIALSEGQFDLVGPLAADLTYRLPNGMTELVYPKAQMVYLAVNYDPKNAEPLPVEVRQALQLALDREAILAETLPDAGQALAGPLLSSHWAHNDALALPGYDPEAAQALLAQAGLRDEDGDGWLDQDGKRLELSIRLNAHDNLHQNLGWLISSYYRDVGLFVRTEGVGFDSIIDDLFTHDFELALYSWFILPDPDQQLYWRSTENAEGLGLNVTSYQNPRLDRLFDRGNTVTGCDPTERSKTYDEIQEILSQDRPVDFLVAPAQHILTHPRLQGLQPGPFSPLTWNAAAWDIEGE